MTRRIIALLTLAALLGLPLLTGCESRRANDDGGSITVDTEGENKGVRIDDKD